MEKPNGSMIPLYTVVIVLVGLFIGAVGFLYGRLIAVEAITNANTVNISVNTERIVNLQKNLDSINLKLDKIIEMHSKQ